MAPVSSNLLETPQQAHSTLLITAVPKVDGHPPSNLLPRQTVLLVVGGGGERPFDDTQKLRNPPFVIASKSHPCYAQWQTAIHSWWTLEIQRVANKTKLTRNPPARSRRPKT